MARSCFPRHLHSIPPPPEHPAAYFVFLGMLAVVACVEPIVARYFSSWWSEHEMEVKVPRIPVVLKVRLVGANGGGWLGGWVDVMWDACVECADGARAGERVGWVG